MVTLIIVKNEKLLEQQKEEIVKHTSLTVDDIGLIKANKFLVEGKSVILSTPQTLCSKFKNNRNEFYPKFRDVGIGLVIYDEMHVNDLDWLSGTLLINTPHMIGLSATPFHSKDKMKLLFATFGEIESEWNEHYYQPIIKFHEYDTGLDLKYGKRVAAIQDKNLHLSRSIYNKALVGNSVQTNKCVDIMKEEIDAGNRMIVIVSTVNQLNQLYDAAIKNGLHPTKLYSKSNTVNKEKDNLLIATVKYASEGFDYKDLNRLLIATPLFGSKSLIQTIGRILRECQEKTDAIVHDLIDIGGKFAGKFLLTEEIKIKILQKEYDECVFEKIN